MNEIKVISMAHAFESLGLKDRRVTREQIKKAYREQIKLYHPDKVAHLGPELRKVAAHKTTLIKLAFQYLQANVIRNPQATTASPQPRQPPQEEEAWRKRQQEEDLRIQQEVEAWRVRRARAVSEARERGQQAREAESQAHKTRNQFWQTVHAPFAFLLVGLKAVLRLSHIALFVLAPLWILVPLVGAILLTHGIFRTSASMPELTYGDFKAAPDAARKLSDR
jgi:DnaJ-class molecular chaperone